MLQNTSHRLYDEEDTHIHYNLVQQGMCVLVGFEWTSEKNWLLAKINITILIGGRRLSDRLLGILHPQYRIILSLIQDIVLCGYRFTLISVYI